MDDALPLQGGYAGIGAADPDHRDVETLETILTGDLLTNDGPGFANNDENSFHVLGALSVHGAELDGFTITAGNADDPRGPTAGAGFLILDHHPDHQRLHLRGQPIARRSGCQRRGHRRCQQLAGGHLRVPNPQQHGEQRRHRHGWRGRHVGFFARRHDPELGFLDVPDVPDTGNGDPPIVDMGAHETGSCLALVSQEVVCSADGSGFTVVAEGVGACGGAISAGVVGSSEAVGEDFCFTVMVTGEQGGYCCSTQLCVPVPDCTPPGPPLDVDALNLIDMLLAMARRASRL